MTEGRDQSDGSSGFAAMDDDQQRDIARKGGAAAARENQRDEQGRFDGGAGGAEGEPKFGEEFIKRARPPSL
jgi:general stress protein YciG